jgi:hypothetical protein
MSEPRGSTVALSKSSVFKVSSSKSGLRYSQESRKFEHFSPCLFNTMEEGGFKNWWLASPTGFEPGLPQMKVLDQIAITRRRLCCNAR